MTRSTSFSSKVLSPLVAVLGKASSDKKSDCNSYLEFVGKNTLVAINSKESIREYGRVYLSRWRGIFSFLSVFVWLCYRVLHMARQITISAKDISSYEIIKKYEKKIVAFNKSDMTCLHVSLDGNGNPDFIIDVRTRRLIHQNDKSLLVPRIITYSSASLFYVDDYIVGKTNLRIQDLTELEFTCLWKNLSQISKIKPLRIKTSREIIDKESNRIKNINPNCMALVDRDRIDILINKIRYELQDYKVVEYLVSDMVHGDMYLGNNVIVCPDGPWVIDWADCFSSLITYDIVYLLLFEGLTSKIETYKYVLDFCTSKKFYSQWSSGTGNALERHELYCYTILSLLVIYRKRLQKMAGRLINKHVDEDKMIAHLDELYAVIEKIIEKWGDV